MDWLYNKRRMFVDSPSREVEVEVNMLSLFTVYPSGMTQHMNVIGHASYGIAQRRIYNCVGASKATTSAPPPPACKLTSKR